MSYFSHGYELKKVSSRALYTIKDLEMKCISDKIHFGEESNREFLDTIFNKLGASLSQKIVMKLVHNKEVSWEPEVDFEVESVLDYCSDDDKHYYLIKWKGWSHKHNTWEPEEHLSCYELMAEFLDNMKTSQTSCRRMSTSTIQEQFASKPKKHQKILELLDKIMASNQNDPEKRITPRRVLQVASEMVETDSRILLGLSGNMGQVQPRPAKNMKAHISNKRGSAYKTAVANAQKALLQWEKDINRANKDPAPVKVENVIDLEGPPAGFQYVSECIYRDGVPKMDDPIVGCECDECITQQKICCGHRAGSSFAYYKKNKRVRLAPGYPIYECNKRCLCGPDCHNRVVQHGRMYPLAIFRTNNKGWGVKALKAIKKGSFVMEYVGEVITHEEAEKRGKVYDTSSMTYLFDLDFHTDQEGDVPYIIDAGLFGNVSHFVNHSCEPNLYVYGIWINNLNPQLPHIAFFASRDIRKGEELTFDYKMTGATQMEESQIETAMDVQQPAMSDVQSTENQQLPCLPSNEPSAEIDVRFVDNSEATAVNTANDTAETHDGLKYEEGEAQVPKNDSSMLQQVDEKMVEQVGENMVEQVGENMVEQVGENMVEQVGENMVEKVGENMVEQVGENMVEKVGENMVEQVGENMVEKVGENMVEQVGENMVEQVGESGNGNSNLKQLVAAEPSIADVSCEAVIPTETQTAAICDVLMTDDTVEEEVKTRTPLKLKRKRDDTPPPATKYRMRCQCGTKSCRGYLY